MADQPYSEVQATIFGDVLSGSNNHLQRGSTFSTATSVDYVASPTLVIDGTWGLTWQHQVLFPPLTDQKYGSDVLGIPGTNLGTLPYAGGMPQFNVSSYSLYGYSYPPLESGIWYSSTRPTPPRSKAHITFASAWILPTCI